MKRLTLKELNAITLGVSRITEEEDGFHFFRFNEKQEAFYKERNADYYKKTAATAGVRLSFQTDSKSLTLKGSVTETTSRSYYSFDVFKNGDLVGYADNFSNCDIPRDYTSAPFVYAPFEATFDLGEGLKTVTVYFPWTVAVALEVFVDDDAFLAAIRPAKVLLAFGDSITQGYDAMRPSKRYVSRLVDLLGAQEHNRGIGGEVICPELLNVAELADPDYITVAYGTNDWRRSSRETFTADCRAFYKALSTRYPSARIFAMTPIWRKDRDDVASFGPFDDVAKIIADAVKDLPNVILLSGEDLVPPSENWFADFYLHPTDAGFSHYARNLYAKMKEHF